jgi:hypothetical protein
LRKTKLFSSICGIEFYQKGYFLLEDLGGGLIPHQGMIHFLLQMLIAEEVGTRVQPSSL